MRGDILKDTIETVKLLRSGERLATDLATELDCTPRTVYRILNVLQGAGIAVEHRAEGRNVWHSIKPGTIRRVFGS